MTIIIINYAQLIFTYNGYVMLDVNCMWTFTELLELYNHPQNN